VVARYEELMTKRSSEAEFLLLVGATGYLGGKVAQIARERGFGVRALVRPSSDAAALVANGVEVVRGDLLDRASLEAAMQGCTAVIATAIGYANRKSGDIRSAADTLGNRHLADAALSAGIRRLVFCSVLTCDRAKDVPHFWHKKLAEDYFEERRLPFVARRPGAFLDQGPNDFWAAGLRRGRLRFAADGAVPLSFVHANDVAKWLVEAVNASIANGSRIDLGCDRPVSINELASIMSVQLGRPIKTQIPPWPAVSLLLGIGGLVDPWKHDLRAMMSHFQRGGYVADTTKQRECFGVPPSVEGAVARYLAGVGLLPAQGASRVSGTRTA
jgi:uncharacterized protein YbjT (DUF2867 family)